MPVYQKQVRFGPFELDTQCGQLRKDGIGLKLQGQPVQILEILLEKPAELVTREELRQRLWSSDTFVDFDHSLNTAIKRLRQALDDDAETPRYIETIPKRGYRFIGELTPPEPGTDTPLQARQINGIIEMPPTLAGIVSASGQLRRLRTWRIVALSMLSLLLAAGAAYWITSPDPMPRIVGSHVLTHTGMPKEWVFHVHLGSLYYLEQKPSGWLTSQVPLEGGESSEVPGIDGGSVTDISPDGSQLLLSREGKLWTALSSGGSARLLLQDATPFIDGPYGPYFALWDASGTSVFFFRLHAPGKDRSVDLYRINADGTGERLLAFLSMGATHPHRSRDGSFIRFTDLTPEYHMWEVGVDGRNLHPVLPAESPIFGGGWSPDGRHYFFTKWGEGRWDVWSVAEKHAWWKRTPATPHRLNTGPMMVASPIISPDGKALYAPASEPRGQLAVYEKESGKFVPYLGGISACFVDFSRDGQWIAYTAYPDGTLWRSRLDGSERRQLTVRPFTAGGPRWSPDGKLIAFSTGGLAEGRNVPGRIYVVSVEGGAPLLLATGQGIHGPTWSPDGKSIAYAVTLDNSWRIIIYDLKTQKSTILPGSEPVWAPGWSPDGKYLLAYLGPWPLSQKVMLFNFATQTWRELASGGFGWMSWSPDSKYVYSVGERGSLVRVTVATGKKEQTRPLLEGVRATSSLRFGAGWFGFTPDGRLMTTLDIGVAEMYAFDLEYK